MRELKMQNGTVLDAQPDIKLACPGCGEWCEYERRDDDPDTVVRCQKCGKRHSRDSLWDTNTAGIDP